MLKLWTNFYLKALAKLCKFCVYFGTFNRNLLRIEFSSFTNKKETKQTNKLDPNFNKFFFYRQSTSKMIEINENWNDGEYKHLWKVFAEFKLLLLGTNSKINKNAAF